MAHLLRQMSGAREAVRTQSQRPGAAFGSMENTSLPFDILMQEQCCDELLFPRNHYIAIFQPIKLDIFVQNVDGGINGSKGRRR